MLRRAILSAACLGVLAGCGGPATSRRDLAVEYLGSPAHRALGLPFSEAVRAGSTLYVSGQIGNRPGTLELVLGGIGPEATQALENVRGILERNGSSLDHVVKCTVFLADIGEWRAFNEVYRKFFATHLPARSALAASGLALGARVEVDCIAVLPSSGEH